LFWTGRSHAVRLPKAFRFAGNEIRVRRQGAAVVLEPMVADWSWLDAIAGNLDADFVEAALDARSATAASTTRRS